MTLIVALIGMPFVLLYTAGVYYIFRGKTVVDRTAIDRLIASAPGSAARLGLAVAGGFLAAVVVVAAAYLTSRVIADVFLGGATLGAVVADCSSRSSVLAVVRTALLVGADALAQERRAPDQGSPPCRPDGPPLRARARAGRRASGSAS